MSPTIEKYPCIPFGELNWCHEHGIMYQRDMTASVEYDKSYFEHYVRLEKTDIALELNTGRTKITEKRCLTLLDIGVGSGEFIKSSNIMTYGYDINPVAIRWLKEQGLYIDPYLASPKVDGLTFWDSMEHIPNPDMLLETIQSGTFVFISMPVFSNLINIRKSKHYKPNEHYYYFTAEGMIMFMKDSGFHIVEIDDMESKAGREDIMTFVFRKN